MVKLPEFLYEDIKDKNRIFQNLAVQWPGSRWNDECMKRVAVWEDLIGREYKLLVEMDKMGITKYKA